MKVALGLAVLSLLLLLWAITPGNYLRDVYLWLSGTAFVLAFRAGEIARFGKGG